MDVDATLAWILRLGSTLDACLEGDAQPDADSVYTLVGLLSELDRHLRAGGSLPRRWSTAAPAAQRPLWVVFNNTRSENDDQGARAARRKRLRARERSHASVLEGQLALPFAPAGA